MADVSRVAERGQIILVMGLLIAVSIVLLTVLVNGLIFTENLASRETGVDGTRAIEFRAVVSDGASDLLLEVNERNLTERGDVVSNVSDGLTSINEAIRLRRAQNGIVTNVSNITVDVGGVMWQNDSSRQMTSAGGTANWTLVTTATDTRRFEINVSGGLDTSNDPDEGFRIVVEGSGGNTWELFVYADALGEPKLAVKNGTGSVSADVCGGLLPASLPTVVNLTAGTVDGSACSAINYTQGITPPYDIEYVFGNRSEGTYTLRVNVSGGSVQETNFNEPAPAASPYWRYTGYSLRFDVLYATTEFRYRSSLRVVPSEFV